ncbi:MAG: arsenite methyltransferase [Phycisphaerae bacterium]|jgi:SAM-dependent methyltransferase|nr:arsenite methyltransferase [Phycisphaerae bacterium]
MTDIREEVRKQYGKIGAAGRAPGSCCSPGCCSPLETGAGPSAADIGYSQDETSSLPEGANLGLGCGNPQAIASLQPGETVVDLGSGGGIDCFLAAKQVSESGKVIGVDMTPEMIDRARENARNADTPNVEFRLGEIEHLPLADATVDVIMSNCVINLSPDKPAVFSEAFRILKPGGRLAISDIVATAPLPDEIRENIELHVGCVAGAATIDETRSMLTAAGFEQIRIETIEASSRIIGGYFPGLGLENYVVSATIEAVRP